MKIVFHKSGGRQMYQSAARSFRKAYGRRLREPLCVVCRGTAPHGFFYRPR